MSSSATAIAIFDVDASERDRVLAWQAELDEAAARQAGFVGSHFTRGFDDKDDWAAAVTFESERRLRSWLESKERLELLAQGPTYGARPRSTLVLLPGEKPPSGIAVFLHSVSPEDHVGFLRAEAALNQAALAFPGYLGGLVLAPSDPDATWISVVRFTNDRMLHAWLTSPERREQLGILRGYLVQDFEQITRSTPFGSIVRVVNGQTESTPVWKTAMIVLMVLFPTVMLLSRFFAPQLYGRGLDPGLTLWLSNVVSTVVLTWLLMPLATHIFRFWLDPVDGASRKVTIQGTLIVLAVYAMTLLVFEVQWLQYWDYDNGQYN